MSLGLRCPTCQKRMSVPERSLGRRVQCPRCESVFRFTGQKGITLGRVRPVPADRAEMATPVVAGAKPAQAWPVMPKMLETTPVVAPPPGVFGSAEGPAGHGNTLLDQGETVPVINLPEVPQALLDQLQRAVHDDVELFEDADEPVDLEMFHSTPTEAVLPDVSDAEIEAIFRGPAPSAELTRPPAAPGSRFSEATVPVQHSLPSGERGPAGAAAMSGEELTEILETDVIDDELPWDFNEVALDAAIEPLDEAVLDVEAELIEVLPEDLETPDAEGSFAIDTLPVAPSNRPPVLLATPVFGAVPVPGMPVAGIPRATATPVAAALSTAHPVSKEPIPPPTPPAKPPIDDSDLDALFQDALEEAPAAAGANGSAPAPKTAPSIPDVAPRAEAGPTQDGEDDLDLMSLFEDDEGPEQAPLEDDDAIEIVDDTEYVFDDKPSAESNKKR